MRSKSIQRQIALVSYGTRFLRGQLPVDDWYRHGIFWGARLQFRAPDNTLLADDFTWWLGMLARSGAGRLSLHLREQFGVEAPRAVSGGHYVVVAHFADHYELWVTGEECAEWPDHPLLAYQPGQSFPQFPNAAYYGGDLDSYWRMEKRPGVLDIPDTDWKALAAVVEADLEITVPCEGAAAGPIILPPGEQADWAKFPLFPSLPFTLRAHQLLATLYLVQSKFANDTHPKNEGNLYLGLSEQGAVKLSNWAARLDSWAVEVELRCANEYRDKWLGSQNSVLSRVYTTAPKMDQDAGAPAVSDPQAPVDAVSCASTDGKSMNGKRGSDQSTKWSDRIVLAIVVPVFSLLILGLAIVIAEYPWLSILGGLPWALHVRSKLRKTATF